MKPIHVPDNNVDVAKYILFSFLRMCMYCGIVDWG